MPYKFNLFTGTLDKVTSGGGSSTWVGLTDTASSLSGQGGKAVNVNVGGTALELVSSVQEFDGGTHTDTYVDTADFDGGGH